ncbi:hypothetical protein AQUCO_02000258v1 [Aquilegia coerulea]|uniref:Pentacotripeptide-repeat region of PRORP domain-containing protein n=1 Tax=Aquilegia coerulea TaxID=218851 RepID=A0A2G5DGQ9_AQUCA|nr:hypothetical protein AQUCO_02000258v1 [Aquilegia coerulea]
MMVVAFGNRVLAKITKRGLRISLAKFHTTLNSSNSNVQHPLLVKLLKESNSNIKTTLDSEAKQLKLKEDSFVYGWEPLITSLRSSSPQKAQLVLEWMLENMLKKNEKDHGCYSELIYLCGKVQNVHFALQVFSLMETHGIRPTSAVFNSLICTCLCSNHVTTALSLFEIMQRSENYKPNLATYNAFISMFSKLGDVTSMRVWYSASTTAGFPPTVQTFEYLVSGSVKSQDFESADKFYEEMFLLGIMPNMSILENMLEGVCQQKKLSKIKEFLNFILDGGWNVNVHMVTKLVGVYLAIGKVEDMEELLVTVMRTNQDSEVLSQMHCGVIRMYALSDRLDDMEFSIGRMLKQGMSFTCADDVERVICSYFRRAASERLEIFLERIQGSYKLARSTYDLLVSGYRRAGMFDKLDSVVKEMRLAKLSMV